MRISSAVLALVAAACLPGAAQAQAEIGSVFHRLDRGRIVPATLQPGVRAVLVYYGASWCGPCRAFLPELDTAYPQLRARGIEVLFVSDDVTCSAARDYARSSRMTWLLLPCDPPRQRRLRALGGSALPGAVLLDRGGQVQRSSWHRDGRSTPRQLLADILATYH